MLSIRVLNSRAGKNVLAGAELLLAPALLSLSDAVSGPLLRPQALAAGLVAGGKQRLVGLLAEGARLKILPKKASRDEQSEAEPAGWDQDVVRALFQLCLGLVLRWLALIMGRRHMVAARCDRLRESPRQPRLPPIHSFTSQRLCFTLRLA